MRIRLLLLRFCGCVARDVILLKHPIQHVQLVGKSCRLRNQIIIFFKIIIIIIFQQKRMAKGGDERGGAPGSGFE